MILTRRVPADIASLKMTCHQAARRRHFIFLCLAATVVSFIGCMEQDEGAGIDASLPPKQAYDVPLRSDEELAGALESLCAESQSSEPGLALVEFSASWCSDCRKLHDMKQTSPLAETLDGWPHITINVGRFDRHRPLLDALRVEKIAHWSIFAPTDCAEPITRWPRLSRRTLEVSSGPARNLSPQDLADWLASLRKPYQS